MKKYKEIKTDVLVIGGGGAGLRAAIEARKQGAKVILVAKEVLGCAHTGMAMGGMNAALRAPATTQLHYEDTMHGGWDINNKEVVRTFAEEIPQRIHDLEEYGLLFDRTDDGEFYVWRGGKQTAPLNVCVGDYTGREMMQVLVDQMRKSKVVYFDEFFITNILKKKNEIIGAFGIDLKSGAYVFFKAKSIILCTGGAGRMYKVTTNAASNTGDGYAMAYDIDVEFVDMEMLQFHPTGMVFPDSVRGVLVTEKVRGHGGKLFNSKGERFMQKYYPKMMELAGRDEVARSIYQEVKEGRGTTHGGVYLDVTHLPKGEVEDKIPDVFEQYMTVGVDIRKTPMEIYPTMHHVCGGVKINKNGQTNIKGLYAAGEVVGGIHGANRLGGNSIADGQVFGRRAAIKAALYSQKKNKAVSTNKKEITSYLLEIEDLLKRKEGEDTYQLEEILKNTMWDKVGMVRTEESLQEADTMAQRLMERAKNIKVKLTSRQRNKELQDALELINMLKTARLFIKAALIRKESRGAHYRSDYPERSEKWQKNIILKKGKQGIDYKITEVK